MTPTIAFGTTFLLGALHGLEPGHGKSFLAAYIVGKKLDVKQVFTLGLSMIGSHFLVLLVLALSLKFAITQLGQEDLISQLHFAVPLLVIAFGLFLLFRYKRSEKNPSTCCHHHDKQPAGSDIKKSAFAGMLSGLIPCPTAIAPLVMSGLDGDITNTVMYVLIYVIGMGIILISLIFLFRATQQFIMAKLSVFETKVHPHLLSAWLVIFAGSAYLVAAIISH